MGENKYGATIDVIVNITKDTFNTEVIVDNVTPKVSHMEDGSINVKIYKYIKIN